MRSETVAHWSPFFIVGALCAMAFALCWHGISSKPIWYDETFSFAIARLGWSDFLRLSWLRECNMAAYYVVLNAWLRIGSGTIWMRSLSIVFSLATVPVLYILGKRLCGRSVG